MKGNIVITGVGIIGACGTNTKEFWENLCLRKANIEKIPQSISSKIEYGGRVPHVDGLFNRFSKRLINKCDNFSKLALIAADEAINQSGFNDVESDRVGIFIGNNTGGWNSSHSGLQNLYVENKPVSPYMASNWFPAAAQGHISLEFGFTGTSKTLIADRASGILAIKHAIKNLNLGKIDIAVVGGVEAPIDEWAMFFYESTKEVSNDCRYEFGGNSTGFILSEGAGFLVLESKYNAKKRKAHILAEIDGLMFRNYSSKDLEGKTQLLSDMLYSASDGKSDNMLIFPACVGKSESDDMEINAIKKLSFLDSYISVPKLVYGNTIAAGSIMDIIIAIESIYKQIIPSALEIPVGKDLNLVPRNIIKPSKPISNALIMSNGFGGSLGTILIKK